jgi:glycerol-3-phosphate cytidylyltransferase
MRVGLNAAICDCYHKGHKNLHQWMRDNFDKVVVILHDDVSCYNIKEKFPVQTLDHRIKNVKLTGLVDRVEDTNSEDPCDEFEAIINEYGAENVTYVRGDDMMENFPGKWKLEEMGVQIEYRPYTKGVSSTQIRDEICR